MSRQSPRKYYSFHMSGFASGEISIFCLDMRNSMDHEFRVFSNVNNNELIAGD